MADPNNLVSERLPLYWRLAPENSDSPIGIERLPFKFANQAPNWLLTQEVTSSLREALSRIYAADANIGYLQPGYEIAAGYLRDFVDFILEFLPSYGAVRALEVGCGGCEVLDHLSQLGLEVLGIDPSPVARRFADQKGIDLLQEDFWQAQVETKFHLAFCSDVLEHVENPVSFLNRLSSFVLDGGTIAIAVPDCTESLALGDVSFAMHQHINYFSDSSLRYCMQLSGLTEITVKKSAYGGSLYASGRVRARVIESVSDREFDNSPITLEASILERTNFLKLFPHKLRSVRSLVSTLILEKESVGFYVPLRALPFVAGLSGDSFGGSIRFFDDTEHWHNKYFDGCKIPIENFSDLRKSPPDHLFVMSLTFADVIMRKVMSAGVQLRSLRLLRSLITESN
jgi:SAM-dependent methyltransferase